MRLRDMLVGHKGRILHIESGEPFYRQRLVAMGLLPGTEFTVTRIAPLGDPIIIFVRGFLLGLRKKEANILKIERIQEAHS